MPQEPTIFVDGFSEFSQGIDSGIAPLLLPRNKLSFLINGTVRGSYVTARPPLRKCVLTFADTAAQAGAEGGLFQGGNYYQPDSGSQTLIAQIGGRLFQFIPDPGQSASVTEITIAGDPNPANIQQAWLWQAEKWMIVQDGQDSPIFYDGTVSRRSQSNQTILGTVDVAGFVAPAIGATVTIPLVAPGFLGQIGDVFFIDSAGPSDGASYQATYPPATANATVTTLLDSAVTRNIGEAVIINPNIFGVHLTTNAIPGAGMTFGPGGAVFITHLDASYTGPTGVLVVLFGKIWEVTNTGGPFISLLNQQTVTLPATINAGDQITYSGTSYPIQTLGTVSAAFAVPITGSSVDIIISSAYTGTNGQQVFIGTGHYTIAQKPAPPPGVTLTAQNINDTLGNAVVSGDTLLSVPEIPPGRMGCYGMGRNWFSLTDGRTFTASDIVGFDSGTPLNDFRDSVLKTTANLYLAGGGNFVVPGTIGDIQAMIFTATLDTSLGQGPLQVFTPNVVFSVNAPVDNTDWQIITNPILTQSLISNGALGQNSTLLANSDTLFRSIDGIRSLILAKREFATWGNTPISHEVERIINQDDPSLLQFGSAVIFQNRLLMTSKPVASAFGTFNQGFIALNFEPVSSIAEKSPSVYDGLWTGINTLQVIHGRFGTIDRCFAFTYNDQIGKIELYEIMADETDLITDNNGTDIPITWQFETGCLFKDLKGKGQFDPVRILEGELYVAEVAGRVRFQVFYRSQFDPCWHPWHDFSICAEQEPVNAKQQNRVVLGLPRPPVDACDPSNNRPYYIGETFQVKIRITGHCRFYGILVKANQEPRPVFAKPICHEQECRLIQCPPDDDYGVYQLQDLPVITPPVVCNKPLEYCQTCEEGEVLQYTGSLPSWLTIDTESNCLVTAAGVVCRDSQGAADDAMQVLLDDFVTGALAGGSLDCQGAVSFFFIPEDSAESDLPTYGVCALGNTYFSVGAEIYFTTDGTDRTHVGTAGISAGTMTFGGGLFVITNANAGGQIQTSPDGVTWTNRTSASANIMRAGVYANGRFVLVGLNGDTQRSSDGINWTNHPSGGADGFRGVTFGNSLYVAVGENGAIYTSPDGATWTVRVSGTAGVISAVATDGTNFIAVDSQTPQILSSADGVTWVVNPDTTSGASSVAFGSSTWAIGTGDNQIWSSSDGLNYTVERMGGPGFAVFYMLFCEDRFAALQFLPS